MYLRTHYAPSVRFQEIRYQMQMFMSFKQLSTAIQQRILTFYDLSFGGRFFRRRDINELLENELRLAVSVETRRHLLERNYFFKQLPDALMNSMANCMSEVIFLRNDVICKVDAMRAQVRPTFAFHSTWHFPQFSDKNSGTLLHCERNRGCLHWRGRRSRASLRWKFVRWNGISAIRRELCENLQLTCSSE